MPLHIAAVARIKFRIRFRYTLSRPGYHWKKWPLNPGLYVSGRFVKQKQ